MAIERHVIELAVRDAVSKALKDVGVTAEQTGKKAEAAAKRATASTRDWEKAGRALGTGLGVLTVAAVKLGNDSEVVQRRLQASIENTGHSYEEYADALDKASASALQLAFDDEDAMTAVSQLTDATGDASKAINDLALAQDIARGRGIDLAAATQIVIAAETGRFQSLKRLGIAVDENATKEEVLASLQAKYAGQAQAYAETNQATWDRFGNTIENTLESIGGHLADFQGPLVALSAGMTALGPLGQAFDALDGKAKVASVSSKILASSWAGPAGLAIGAGIAGVAIYELMTRESDHERQVRELDKATQGYIHTLSDLTTELVRAGAYDISQDIGNFLDVWITNGGIAQARIDELTKAQEQLLTASQLHAADDPPVWESAVKAGLISEYTAQILAANDANNDGALTTTELANAQADLAAGFEITTGQAADLKAAYTGLLDDIANPELYGTEIAKEAQKIIQDVVNGVIDVQTGIERLNALPLDPKFNKALQETKKNADGASSSIKEFEITVKRSWGGITLDMQGGLQEITTSFEDWQDSLNGTGHAIEDVTERIDAQKKAHEELVGSFNAVDRSTKQTTRSFEDLTGWMGDAADASAALDDQLASLSDTLGSMTPGSVLDSTFGAIVGNTDKIVGSIDKVKQWSDAIMAPLGTDFQDNGALSKLVELQNKGLLDAEDYTEALEAQTQIYGDLARAQDASAAIQIKQANILADQTDAAADYLENIAKMPEAEQAIALAWADQDISGRAMQITDMAAGWGEMNQAQQEAFADMVTSAAAVDPMLAGLLESIGLIKRDVNDPTGWTLVIPADGAQATIQDVVDAIDRLTAAILGIPDAKVTVTADTTSFWNTIGGIPQLVGDRYINVHGVGFYQEALGGVSPWPDTAALGRVSAGNATLVGENGPEIVNLPGGALVTPNHASRYMTPKGGGGINIYGDLHFHGVQNPQQFMRQMRDYSSTMERR